MKAEVFKILNNFKVLNTEQSRHSFYRAANATFGRIGKIATEDVVLHLLQTKCIPIFLYGLEVCPLRKTGLNSLDFVVNRFFYKTVSDKKIWTLLNPVSRTPVFNCPVLFSESVLQNLT